jgi:signal transduction histidine kinase
MRSSKFQRIFLDMIATSDCFCDGVLWWEINSETVYLSDPMRSYISGEKSFKENRVDKRELQKEETLDSKIRMLEYRVSMLEGDPDAARTENKRPRLDTDSSFSGPGTIYDMESDVDDDAEGGVLEYKYWTQSLGKLQLNELKEFILDCKGKQRVKKRIILYFQNREHSFLLRGVVDDSFGKHTLNAVLYEDAQARATEQELENEQTIELISRMSHEIRTPLNGLICIAQILQRKLPKGISDEDAEMVDLLVRSGEDLRSIVSDILVVNKIKLKETPVEKLPINIRSLVDDVHRLFNSTCRETNISLDYKVSPEVPVYVISDGVKIKQIIKNILSNAIKYAKTRIHLLVEFEPPNQIVFSTTDDGIGIEEGSLIDIFQPFYQVNRHNKTKFEGTGLGLAISRGYAELLGGTITVKSKVGMGSTFVCRITIEHVDKDYLGDVEMENIDVERNHRSISNDRNVDEGDIIKKSPRILVVEDHIISFKVINRMLKDLGLEADHGDDGPPAIELSLKNKYDIILLDLHLPTMSGFDTMAAIKKAYSDIGHTTRFVAMTASVMFSDMEKCKKYGIYERLPKPIDRKLLIKILNK